jgi:hypothetical protein
MSLLRHYCHVKRWGSFLRYKRTSSVSIATGLRTGRREFDSQQGQGFSLRHRVQTGSEAHPASYKMGIMVFSPGVKRMKREVTTHFYLAPRWRMRGAISPLLRYVFMARYLLKHMYKLYLYPLLMIVGVRSNGNVFFCPFGALGRSKGINIPKPSSWLENVRRI